MTDQIEQKGDFIRLITNFIGKHRLAMLATVSPDNEPEAAVIEFSQRKNLELIFDTFTTFRKYKNLKSNSRVAVVIGWDDEITVQYEGIAIEVVGDELIECKQIHVSKLPESIKFTEMPKIRFFKVIPKWIRYSDLRAEPWESIEFTF